MSRVLFYISVSSVPFKRQKQAKKCYQVVKTEQGKEGANF